ncbi:MAG: DUF1203 domain-containing protein [Verrucomicrobiota bacterium]|nr:DUF1203 domain-containing protein [Verrucomicrobiota bacterium]
MRTNNFRVVALPTEVAKSARDKAELGTPDHKVSVVELEQSAPCRHCLTWAKTGERVILFPYQAIASDRPYAESGPIFVHADPCPRYDASDEFPPELRNGRVIRAYNYAHEIVAAEMANGVPEETAARLLQNPCAAFLHVRSATHGCYTFKVERA